MALRRLNWLILTFLLAFGLVFQSALPAHACSCAMPDPYAGLASGDGAFVGTLVDVDRGLAPITDSGQLVDYHFEVEAALKGDIGETVVVRSANSGASCGIEMPIGTRVGLTVYQVDGGWEGNSCATYDADTLLLAAEGPPEPVKGMPPLLVAMTQMGDAGVVAVDQNGDIVGYGEGPAPTLVSACPDDESFVGLTQENSVRVWSFTDLAVVDEYRVDSDVSPWFYQLICAGPGGNPFLALTTLSGAERTSLIRQVDGATEVLREDVEWLVGTSRGPVVISSDGIALGVDPDSGALTEQSEPIGDLHGQLTAVVASPDGSHIALGAMDWNVNPPRGRFFVIDLESGTATGLDMACDVYPIWVDDDTVSVWDCNTGLPTLYSADLEVLGPGDTNGSSLYGWSLIDESGAIYYQGEFGLEVLKAEADMATQFGPAMGYVNAALLVPEAARTAWTGSEFIPAPFPDIEVTPETLPPPGEVPTEEPPTGYNSPVWLVVVGGVVVTGALWLLVRSPSEPDSADPGDLA